MEIQTFVLGMVEVNTYLCWSGQHVLIIDPGSKSTKLLKAIKDREGIVDGIICTHGHFDHIAGVDACVEEFKADFYMHPYDIPLCTDIQLNGSAGWQPITIKAKPIALDSKNMRIGNFDIGIIDAPGHSEGSAMLLIENYLFSGDVLFASSIGRVDLPRGSQQKMSQTLQLFTKMNDDYIVYPGHGPQTTLQYEKMHNPYLR